MPKHFRNCYDRVAVAWLIVNFALGIALWLPSLSVAGELPAFHGAVGQGAAATGGRGGDVYHVTNLKDYDPDKGEPKIPGSLRHAIRSATGPRTIVFDVGGAIALSCPLEVRKSQLTIAGQTSPTGAITLWGYPLEISDASDVVVRYLRVRLGDFHARRSGGTANAPGGSYDLEAASANAVNIGNGCERVILDHVSASWGMDETLSVTDCRDVTVQNSIISESLNNSYHPKGAHGYGSLVRGDLTPNDQHAGVGGYTFYANLWAHHRARNPSLGGQQRLNDGQSESDRRRTDVNLVNNVIYDWGDQPTHRSEFGDVRLNLVGNYYVNGPEHKSSYIFNESNPARTLVYHRDNYHDADQDELHNGTRIDSNSEPNRSFRGFGVTDVLAGGTESQPHNFFRGVEGNVLSAEQAYSRVVASAGASLVRDSVDERVVGSLVHRSGRLIDSQEDFQDSDGRTPGIDDLETLARPSDFDTDGDGIPNQFEVANGLDANDPADGNATNRANNGYTNLEVYLSSLTSG